jgi:RNA polymerase sigma-70 factor (ECF subfamily)
MVGDRGLAEDLLQDVFHDAFRAREQLREVRNADAWLFGIARNRALNALRKGRRLQAALTRLARRPAAAESDHELLALRDLLERHVSAEDRSLLILRYLHGFDARELGEMTGRTAEAVRQRLARARAKLVTAADSTQEG